MKLLEGHDAAVAKFVADFAPLEKPEWQPGYRAFGIISDEGLLLAGVVFHDWHPVQKRVEISGAAIDPRALGPRLLGACADYALGKLAVHRIWARTSIDNTRARRFLKGIGFIEEGVQAHWYKPGVHAVTYRVTPIEWKRKWPTRTDVPFDRLRASLKAA